MPKKWNPKILFSIMVNNYENGDIISPSIAEATTKLLRRQGIIYAMHAMMHKQPGGCLRELGVA